MFTSKPKTTKARPLAAAGKDGSAWRWSIMCVDCERIVSTAHAREVRLPSGTWVGRCHECIQQSRP